MKRRRGEQTAGKRGSRSISRREWRRLKDRGKTRCDYAWVQKELTRFSENSLQNQIAVKLTTLGVTFMKNACFASRNFSFWIWFKILNSNYNQLHFLDIRARGENNFVICLYDNLFWTQKRKVSNFRKDPLLLVYRVGHKCQHVAKLGQIRVCARCEPAVQLSSGCMPHLGTACNRQRVFPTSQATCLSTSWSWLNERETPLWKWLT